jgi:hypothetical protein
MTISTIVRLFGLSRAGFGLWLALAPRKPGEMWFGNSEHPASTTALLRSVGGRDVGLGLGLIADPAPDSLWLRVGILADAVDAGAALLVRDRVPKKNFLTGFLGGLSYAAIGAVIMLRGRKADRWAR